MKKFKGKSAFLEISIALLLACLMMPTSGCITAGSSYVPQEKLSLLKENQTTKPEVIKLLGKPLRTQNEYDGKGEIVTYDYVNTDLFSSKKDCQTVNLFIDDTGILKKISINERTLLNYNFYTPFIEQEKLALLESKVNQMTKAEVMKLIGNPFDIHPGKGGKGENLTYYYIDPKEHIVSSDNAGVVTKNMNRQAVVLFIDDTGILKKVSVCDTPTKIHEWTAGHSYYQGNYGVLHRTAIIDSDIGDYIEPEKLSLLKENQTTKGAIIELIGKPQWITAGEDGKGEFFSYHYMKNNNKYQIVTLFIDDTDILRKIKIEEKNKD